jgi:hypothetical protein
MARQKYGFLLFDFPSDHEVDLALPTESEVVWALLINRDFGTRVKLIKATTEARLKKLPSYRYAVQFVHVAGHGSAFSLGLLGGSIGLRKAARLMTRSLHRLRQGEKRILCLSCCYSREAFKRMRPYLRGYFTGCYYFRRKRVTFAQSLTTWSMFYYRKDLRRPHHKIIERINDFFQEDILEFETIEGSDDQA